MIEVPPAGWLHPDVDVRPSPISGVGLFTRSGLAVGTVVSRLGGELVSTGTLEELIALAVRGERPYVDSIAVTDDAHLLLPPGQRTGVVTTVATRTCGGSTPTPLALGATSTPGRS